MVQMLLEAESKLDLKPFAQIARKQGITVRYVAQKEKKSKNPNNPSPSGDPWFDDPRNMAGVMEGIKDLEEGRFVRAEDSPVIQELFAKYGRRKKEYV
jgi:transcriptional regulator with XRE-family HTH domain